MTNNFCEYLGRCGGCAWGLRPLGEQRAAKLADVSALGVPATFRPTPDLRLRDRVDLTWQGDKLGLYSLDGAREVVDLESCPMLSAPLEAWFKEYRQIKPPGIVRGSVRLRVSPSGARGAWLDFANADIKRLFDERAYLRSLSDRAFVEIGQRRKALTWIDGVPKLTAPILNPWFETYGPAGEAIPLFGPVGGFSQAGFTANRALIEAVADAVDASGVRSWTELFAGAGNFALALASRRMTVTALELEELAIDGQKRALEAHPEWQVTPKRADVYLKLGELPTGEGLLVDPPRAGLRRVLELLRHASAPPKTIVYVSCFPASLLSDAKALEPLGYHVRSVEGVDQFAHSAHAEWVVRFER